MTQSPWTPLLGSIVELQEGGIPFRGIWGKGLSSLVTMLGGRGYWHLVGMLEAGCTPVPRILIYRIFLKKLISILWNFQVPHLKSMQVKSFLKLSGLRTEFHFTDINTQPSLPSFITEFSKNTATFGAREEIALCLMGTLPIVSHMSENA